MAEIDKIYTDFPYYGARKITAEMRRRGFKVNRKRIRRLMRQMGIEAIYQKPDMSKNDKAHPVYPYLLKGLDINKPDHVWGIDITYIRLTAGWLYLVAIIDWFSRYVIDWQVSTSLDTSFCLEAIERSLNKSRPEILNSDQGVQFTSKGYMDLLASKEVKISMDGRGRCMDNIFTERLWRSVKYEEVYLNEYDTVQRAKSGLEDYFYKYNNKRIHQHLDYKTPAEVYFTEKL